MTERWNEEEATPVEDIKTMVELVKATIGYIPCSGCGCRFFHGIITKCPICNLLRENEHG